MRVFFSIGGVGLILASCGSQGPDFSSYPSTTISNEEIEMLLYLPDAEKGLYRASRFDWSGIIMSTTWKGHEYFGYWKDSHDPLVHEDLGGPVEGYIKAGLGYDEAGAGGAFVRIGVGLLEKPDEEEYQWMKTYKILDPGNWTVQQGPDWISFSHRLETEIGYAYMYKKTIRLESDGFSIDHVLVNTGEKPIETDQFNHNFFMIDGDQSGPVFELSFPFKLETEDDLRGMYRIEDRQLLFEGEMQGKSHFVDLQGFGAAIEDHGFEVVNTRSGAGVRMEANRPMYSLGFWSCGTTLCPENSVWISVLPGQQESWAYSYKFFQKD